MQCGSNRIWDEAGCFVYEVTQSRIFVRSSPSVEDNFNIIQNRYFDPEERVSVDLIRHAREDYTCDYRGDNNRENILPDGPFLRLSDGSGWIVARQGRQELARRLPIEVPPDSGKLWTFYADNVPFGIELRRHPVEEAKNPDDTNRFSPSCGAMTYLPMQKIVCDRKLDLGDSKFFRVQGTCGWVFDKRSGQGNNIDGDRYSKMMIPGDLVETGLFAFRITSLNGMSIRKSFHVGDGTNCTNVTVKKGDIVLADIVRYSPLDNGNGPFLRLTDGSGWLFQHKHGGSPLLEEIPITTGSFSVKVLSPGGIKPRGQPIDSYYFIDHTRAPVSKQNEVILCDRKLLSPSGTSFYRKQGTDLWIFDRHDIDASKAIAEVISEGTPSISSLLGKTARNSNDNDFVNSLKYPWNPHYVRGNANGINGLEEIEFDPARKVISYRSTDNVVINVHFETRMIGIVINNHSNKNRRARSQRFHRNCNDAELQAILQNPRTYQRGTSHQSNKRSRLIPSPIDTMLDQNDDRSCGGENSNSSFGSVELQGNPITPDASLSSNIEDDHDFDSDGFDAEQETRNNLLDCQKEMQNLRYREGNLLRAIQIHEEEYMKEAQKMRTRSQQVTAYRIQKEDEEDRRFRLQRENEIPRRIEEERRVEQDRQRRGSVVFENIYVGSIVGCFIGLALSPVCGPFLVRQFGLEHLMM